MRRSPLLASLLGMALLLMLAPASFAAGTPSSSARPDGTIPGRYIVTLVDGADPAAVARDYRARGADVDHVYRAALRGFAGAFPPGLVDRLEGDARVVRVEADGWAHAAALTSETAATWGIDRINERKRLLDKMYSYESTGSGVTAYVLDTGIRSTHGEFTGRIGAGYTAIHDGYGTDDCDGHGTHVAGTLGGTTYGVAKGVTLVPVRVLNCEGSGTWSGVISGVDWVTANHVKPAVANMSLGGSANSSVDDAVRRSINAGVVYTLAAGNNTGYDACKRSPARVAEGLTVGATTSTDYRASYSNIGKCLDLFAPGSSVKSAWITSDTSTASLSGTSMAAPHVAGAAAIWYSANETAGVSAVNEAVVTTATPGVVIDEGRDSPDLLLYSLFGITETVTKPATPANFQGKAASSTQIDLSWSGDSTVDSYALAVVVDGTRTVLESALPAGSTGYSHTGLTAEKTYSYELTATNSAGTSAAATASATTLVAPPATPSGFTATAVSASQIDLGWTDATNETSYRLVAKSGGAVVAEIPLPEGASSYEHTELTSSTTYSYELTAINAGGSSAAASASATTAAGPPPAPSDITATAVSTSQIDVSWSPVSGATHYFLAIDGSETPMSLTATSFTHTGLTPGSTHTYAVQAVNSSGTSTAVTDSATTPLSDIQLSVSAYKVKGGLQKADLSWSGTSVAEVDVYRGGAILTRTANDGAYTDHINNKGGGSYTYKVCEAGTTTCSAEVVVTF